MLIYFLKEKLHGYAYQWVLCIDFRLWNLESGYCKMLIEGMGH